MTDNDTSDVNPAPPSEAPVEPVDTRSEAETLGRASAFSLDIERRSVNQALNDYWIKIRSGEPGALPSILGLVVLGIIFAQVSSRFLSKGNIGNLPGQGAYI